MSNFEAQRKFTNDLKTDRPFPFLELPPELRNYVYEFVLEENLEEIDISRRLPPILQVSRQLRSEGLPIYLNRNRFKATGGLEGNSFLIRWLGAMGTTNLRHLKLLTIDCKDNLASLSDRLRCYNGGLLSWHPLVACLTAFHLEPHQLCWTIGLNEMMTGPSTRGCLQVVQAYFFMLYNLKPLLADHDLLQGDPSFSIMSGLKELEASTNVDEYTSTNAGLALLYLEQSEEVIGRFGSYVRSPANAYAEYVNQIFSPKGNAHVNCKFKHLNRRSEWSNYRETRECQELIQREVELHRMDYEMQRYARAKRESSVVFNGSLDHMDKQHIQHSSNLGRVNSGDETESHDRPVPPDDYNPFLDVRTLQKLPIEALKQHSSAATPHRALPLDNLELPDNVSYALGSRGVAANGHTLNLTDIQQPQTAKRLVSSASRSGQPHDGPWQMVNSSTAFETHFEHLKFELVSDNTGKRVLWHNMAGSKLKGVTEKWEQSKKHVDPSETAECQVRDTGNVEGDDSDWEDVSEED